MGRWQLESKADRILVVALSFVVIIGVAFASPSIQRGYCDFLSFYAGAQLLGSSNLYSAEHAHEIQSQYSEPNEVRAYIRLPFYAVFLWPLGQLPYLPALYAWQFLNIVALAGFVALSTNRAFAAVVCCWFFPTWINFANAQDMPIVLLIVGGATCCLRRRRAFLAGVLLSLCAVKFHLFFLVPILFLVKRQWRLTAGFGLGALLLTIISFIAGGLNWPLRYYSLLAMNEQNQATHQYMPSLNGLFHGWPYAPVWLAAGTILVIAIAWRTTAKAPVEVGLPLILFGGLLVSLHSFMYDVMILIPLFLALMDRVGAARVLMLEMAISIAVLTLGAPPLSIAGQLVFFALFVWLAVWIQKSPNSKPDENGLAGPQRVYAGCDHDGY